MVCLLCALVLCLSCCSLAGAEAYGIETRNLDLERIEWAMAMAAEMSGNALDRMEEAGTVRQRSFLNLFARIPYLSPDRAVVLEFSEDQVKPVKAALGIDSSSGYAANWEDVSPALAELINRQFSGDYAAAAVLAQAEGETHIEYSRYFTLILLAYGDQIAATSLTAWGNINSRSAFIISTRKTNMKLGEAEAEFYIQELGLDMPLVRIYEKNDLDQMIAENAWGTTSSSFEKMAGAVLSSEKRKETMLPALMQSDSPYMNNEMKIHLVVSALRSMETADQAFLRSVTRIWLPLLAENTEDPVHAFLREANVAHEGIIAPPSIAYGDELHETALKENGTFLTVFDLTIPEEKPSSWYDMILEAALPADRIPESVETADYVIRCSVTYTDGISKGDAHLHYPQTHVTVHDAHTGEWIRDLGTDKRTLSGTIMLNAGDTWWHPLYTDLWKIISTLFEK